MANPLLQFDSPRMFENADGTTIEASTLARLSPDLIAARVPAAPLPGQVSFLTLGLNPGGPFGTALSTQFAAQLANYLPLAQVAIGAEPSTVPRRNADSELIATTFRGAGLRAVDDDSYVAMYTNNLQIVVQAGKEMPSGQLTLSFYGVPRVTRPQISGSGVDLALDILYALNALGLVEALP